MGAELFKVETKANEKLEVHEEKEKIKAMLRSSYADFKVGQLGASIQNTDKYLRKNLAGELSDLMNGLRAKNE